MSVVIKGDRAKAQAEHLPSDGGKGFAHNETRGSMRQGFLESR